MIPALVMAAVGAAIGFVSRKAAAKLARVKDEEGIRYPWPEAMGAAVFALAGWRLGFDAARIPVFVFCAVLIGVMVTDFRYKLIPDRLTFPGTLVGVVVSAIWPEWICSAFRQDILLKTVGLQAGIGGGFLLAALGAGGGFVLFEGSRRVMSRVFKMEVMGMGDSKLTMLMGAYLGPFGVLMALFLSMICGVVIGVIYTRIMKSPHFPFGPGLGLGGLLALLWPSLVGDILGGVQKVGATMDRGVLIFFELVLLGIVVWLMLRVRKRSKEYTEIIEKDYDRLEEED
ncbi:MAG: prepilin peptidase [Planctomycetota bacterium]|jgi:leader peptidase (prepilin peptidase)/N-methyltransferase